MAGRNALTLPALGLGFRAEASFEEIVHHHLEDECGGELLNAKASGGLSRH